MTSYLVLTLACCNTFEGMPPKGNANFEKQLVQFWYPTLWKHKVPFCFYQIQDYLIKDSKSMLTWAQSAKVT